MSEVEIYLFGVLTGVLAVILIGALLRRRKRKKGRVDLERSRPLIRTLKR